MGIFDFLFSKNIDEPVFVKEYEGTNEQLKQLNELLELVGDDQKEVIENEIKMVQAGLIGEKNVAYELKTSFLPIICLHDIRLEYKEFSSQFDFIVISKRCIFVLETKSLQGDVIVDSQGNFIRVFKDYKGNVYKKEGINSPISQNDKHVEILKRFLKDINFKNNIPIASIIIIANPKSIIDLRFAPKEIKDKIIKHDQIKNKIMEITNAINNYMGSLSDKAMMDLANTLLENDRPIKYDYIKKFNLKIQEKVIEKPEEKVIDDTLYENLRQFRDKKAKENNVPIWYLFNNGQLSTLVLNKPKNKEEFINLPGFGEKKYDSFGKEIIKIIWPDTKFEENKQFQEVKKEETNISQETTITKTPLYQALKKFRLEQSKQENIKPYFIYNNEELELLVTVKPQDKEAFIALKGFGEKKFEKYGEQILKIIKDNK